MREVIENKLFKCFKALNPEVQMLPLAITSWDPQGNLMAISIRDGHAGARNAPTSNIRAYMHKYRIYAPKFGYVYPCAS